MLSLGYARPLGQGREAYVWSMFAAFGLFAVGAAVSVWHGIQQLTAESEEEPDYLWAYLVLGLSFILEGVSFLQALRQTRHHARAQGLHPLRYVTETSIPTLRAVFAEDSAALVGVLLAASGIGLHQLTGNPAWDAIGSILIGLLLGGVALFLISRNLDFLAGQPPSGAIRDDALRSLLDHDEIQRISFLYLEYVGPAHILLIAAVDIVGDEPETSVATRLQQVEDDVGAAEQIHTVVLTLTAPGDDTELVPAQIASKPDACNSVS